MSFRKSLALTLVVTSALSLSLAAGPASAPSSKTSPSGPTLVHGSVIEAGTVSAVRAAATSSRYAFIYKDAKNRPARWNPCKTIRWSYNPARQKSGGLYDAKLAMSKVARATGARYKYVGTTKSVPFKGTVPSTTDLRVGWGNTRTHAKLFPKGSRTAGYGSVYYSYRVAADGTKGAPEVITGDVLLNSRMSMTRKVQRLVYLHEVGHATGLGHVNYRSEIMYPTVERSDDVSYSTGDRAGLLKLGSSSGCSIDPIR